MSDVEYRIAPQSDLDLQLLVTDPQWGKDVPPELKDKLKKIIAYYDDKGDQLETIEEQLWGLLSYYTRDIRLGNLSWVTGELTYTRYYLDLAGDCLREGYIGAFLTALSRAITIIETSQSKSGFLRKLFSTIRQEKYSEEQGPQKTGLLGKSKNKYGE